MHETRLDEMNDTHKPPPTDEPEFYETIFGNIVPVGKMKQPGRKPGTMTAYMQQSKGLIEKDSEGVFSFIGSKGKEQ